MNLGKSLTIAALLACTSFSSYAVPARPGIIKTRQADGSMLSIRLHGDEKSNYATTEDGYVILFNDATGNYEYAVRKDNKLAMSGMVAADASMRNAKAVELLAAIDKEATASIAISGGSGTATLNNKIKKAAKPRKILINNFPHFGEQHSIVILMEFTDKKFSTMSDAKQYYTDAMNKEGFTAENGAMGSARDFFVASSHGKFKPTFDVYGPVTIDYKQHDAGQGTYDTAINMGTFVKAAIQKLDGEVDFSQYDHDGDGYVDNVYIYYAGKGAADSNDSRTIWPHAFDMREWGIEVNTNDGVGIGSYTCSNEVDGFRTSYPAGIGTFVHEFGHCLGFADHYDTENSYSQATPGEWDTMDVGSYNNDSNTPPLYSSYECYELGWLEPETLDHRTGGVAELPYLGDSNKAYKLSVPGKENEYFLLENRQQQGWDAYLPASGMLVWHIDIDEKAWNDNTVNNISSHQRVDIVEANGKQSGSSYYQSGIPFPGANNVKSLSFKAWDKTNLLDIENISETGGTVTFNVKGAASGITKPVITVSNISDEGFTIAWDKVENADSYIVDIYTVNDDKSLTAVKDYSDKTVKETSLTVDGLKEQSAYVVSVCSCNGSFYSEADSKQVETTEKPFSKEQVVNARASEIGATSFKASWDALEEAQTYAVTLSELAYNGDVTTTEYGFSERKDGMPANWKTNCNNFISSDGSYGNAAPAIRMPADGSYIIVANSKDNADAMISSISFWYGVTTAAEGSSLAIQSLRNGEWTTEHSIDAASVSSGMVSFSFEPTKQARLYFKRTGSASLNIDDIAVSGKQLATKVVDGYDRREVGNATSFVFSGLNSLTDYSFFVEGLKNGVYSAPSAAVKLTTADNSADGISSINATDKGNNKVYDLSGRPVNGNRPSSGVVIFKNDGKVFKSVK